MSFHASHTVHNFVESNHKLWTFLFSDLNFNSAETLPGFEVRAAFIENSASAMFIRVILIE